MFTSLMQGGTGTASPQAMIICMVAALVLGLILSVVYMMSGTYTKSYVVTLAILPVMVQTVIILVNGNLGAGVAVMGAFNLVRFRSIPGTSREIGGIFFAMIIGLATGMGYVTYAVIIAVALSAFMVITGKSKFGESDGKEKHLRVLIPEDLDYTTVFDDIFEKYTSKCALERVRTTNLGSMYELTYLLTIKDAKEEKNFIDELRCRNGNLMITLGRVISATEQM